MLDGLASQRFYNNTIIHRFHRYNYRLLRRDLICWSKWAVRMSSLGNDSTEAAVKEAKRDAKQDAAQQNRITETHPLLECNPVRWLCSDNFATSHNTYRDRLTSYEATNRELKHKSLRQMWIKISSHNHCIHFKKDKRYKDYGYASRVFLASAFLTQALLMLINRCKLRLPMLIFFIGSGVQLQI